MSQDPFKDSSEPGDNENKSKPMSFSRLAAYCAGAAIFLVSVGFNISLSLSNADTLKSSPAVIWLLLLGLTTISIGSLILAVWLYYVRVVYLRQGPALVPEKWGELLNLSTYSVDRLKHENSELNQLLRRSLDQNSHSYQELIKNFSTLRDNLNSRDEEIERLKSGYDSKVFKSFLRRFLRVDRAIKSSMPTNGDKEALKNYRYISKLMDDALDECGVEIIEPELGSDFRELGSEISDDPKTTETVDADVDFTISKVLTTGYKIVGEEAEEVIIPATVEIFRLKS